MKHKYTTVTTLIAATMLSACAMQPKMENTKANYHLHFYGAKNDTFEKSHRESEVETNEGTIGNKIAHGVNLVRFPLTYGVECNQEKTACKHAVVKTDIEFSSKNINGNEIKLTGILHSEMGRSLSIPMLSPPLSGLSQVFTMTVPNSIELINEAKIDQHFEKTLQIGEKYRVDGLAGVYIDIDFERSADN